MCGNYLTPLSRIAENPFLTSYVIGRYMNGIVCKLCLAKYFFFQIILKSLIERYGVGTEYVASMEKEFDRFIKAEQVYGGLNRKPQSSLQQVLIIFIHKLKKTLNIIIISTVRY